MGNLKVVGKSVTRKDVIDKVTGITKYTGDINMTSQLYGAFYRSPVPHGKIVNIDVTKAKEYPGVRVVITGEDVPYLIGQTIVDQPVLAVGKVRMEGEPIVGIAADTIEAAYRAAALVKVEIEPLPVIDDVMEAMKPDSPLVHEKLEDYVNLTKSRCKNGTNIYDHFTLRKGDVEKGFEEADVIIEKEYDCAMLSHATIETHASIAQYERSGKLTVISAAQSPFRIRAEMARAFGMDESKIRVISPPIGGGFGSKVEMRSEQLAIALAMHSNGKPVKVVFSRKEDLLAGVVRAGVKFRIKTGAKKDGTIVAVQSDNYWDTGAYATLGPVISLKANIALTGPYSVDNIKMDGYCVATNKQLGTAYRGFGAAEAAYVHEQQMDAVAKALGMDPLELRLKNVMVDGSRGHTGETMFTVAIKECLEASAESLGWNSMPLSWITPEGKIRGKGLGAFLKFTGTPSFSGATVKFSHDGSVTLSYGTTAMGQGVGTILSQMVAEELGIDINKVETVLADTDHVPLDKTTTSSRSTHHMGNAVIKACDDAKKKLKHLVSLAWKVPEDYIEIEDGVIRESNGGPDARQVAINDIKSTGLLKTSDPIIGNGSYETSDLWDKPDPETYQTSRLTAMWFFGANAAEVEIDPDTGKIEVIQVAAGHDVGKAINPLNCIQQIEGGVMMGLGNAILEEYIHRDGKLMNGNMVDFKVPTTMDMVKTVKSILIEKAHPEGPYGAKGIGEPSMCGAPAAIASAVGNALGITVHTIPIKPETIIGAARKIMEENDAS